MKMFVSLLSDIRESAYPKTDFFDSIYLLVKLM